VRAIFNGSTGPLLIFTPILLNFPNSPFFTGLFLIPTSQETAMKWYIIHTTPGYENKVRERNIAKDKDNEKDKDNDKDKD
jgi:hypothetical protein